MPAARNKPPTISQPDSKIYDKKRGEIIDAYDKKLEDIRKAAAADSAVGDPHLENAGLGGKYLDRWIGLGSKGGGSRSERNMQPAHCGISPFCRNIITFK